MWFSWSGYLDKDEIIDAVKANKKVINFLQTCGNHQPERTSERAGAATNGRAVPDTDRARPDRALRSG